MNLNKIVTYVFAIVFSALFLALGNNNINMIPRSVYRVYLDGESIGLIDSREALEEYINIRQADLRERFGVDTVHAPEELEIIREVTFNNNITSKEDIYEKIRDVSPFTLSGYRIVIEGLTRANYEGEDIEEDDVYIYVLDKEIFTESMENTIQSFVSPEAMEAFLNDTQRAIENTGSIIENLFISNQITIRRTNIPSDRQIYTSREELSKFLLFGTTEDQQTYIVQSGDTIADVAFNNQISPEEFLIANPQFANENSLLYEGQEVVLGILRPQFDLVEEEHRVTLQGQRYETEIRYDYNMRRGTSKVLQEGVPGENRITQMIQKVNGDPVNVVITNTEIIREPVDQIIVRGGRRDFWQGGGQIGTGVPAHTRGQWAWPTVRPYVISSPFGWRWGTMHTGIDISGSGHGSPIFAAREGTVIISSNRWPNGNYVVIDHGDGWFSLYAHLSARSVSPGQRVARGQVIGGMGRTGLATGTHLHFEIWRGMPFRGGTPMNPLLFY